jgi:hypothetical protein
MVKRFFALVLLAVIPLTVSANGKVESIGAFTDQAASESVRNALEAKGYRVTLSDGSVLCDVWFRNGVPTRNKTDEGGVAYTELGESTLVAVISYPKATKDFRGQNVKAGSYTLRYALHPADGNHMGIAPYRDFLVLVPIDVDREAGAQYKYDELMKLSAKTNGTNHPAPLNLATTEGQKTFPSVFENEQNHVVLVAKLKTAAGGEIPIALIVKGVAEQ